MLSSYFAGQLALLARAVVNEHKKRISRPYPPASRPGQYPARRTGNLRRSTVAWPRGPGRIDAIRQTKQVAVGFLDRAFYGVILEVKMGRKGLAETIDHVIRTRVKGGRLPSGVVWRRTGGTLG